MSRTRDDNKASPGFWLCMIGIVVFFYIQYLRGPL